MNAPVAPPSAATTTSTSISTASSAVPMPPGAVMSIFLAVMLTVIGGSLPSVIEPTASSLTVSPWAVATPRTMLPVVSISISAAAPAALASSVRVAPVLLRKMPPDVVTVVIAAVAISILLPTPIFAAFSVTLAAVMSAPTAFASINSPPARRATLCPVATTAPSSVMVPVAEIETAPPVAVAEVRLRALVLAINRPPPVPPLADKESTTVSRASPPEPMPFDATRTSVMAAKLLLAPFPSRMAPPALSVTEPEAETSPTVMSPVAVRRSMSPVVVDAFKVIEFSSRMKTPPLLVVALRVATSVSIELPTAPIPALAINVTVPPRRSTNASLTSSRIAPLAVMLISLVPASTRPRLMLPVVVSNVNAAVPDNDNNCVLGSKVSGPPAKWMITRPAFVLAETELRPSASLTKIVAPASLAVARKSEVLVSSGSSAVPIPELPVRLTTCAVMLTEAPSASSNTPEAFATVTSPSAEMVWMPRLGTAAEIDTSLPAPPAITDTAVPESNGARKIEPLVVLALNASTVDSIASPS